MNSRTTRAFRARFAALPAQVRHRAKKAYQQFRDEPSHPGLQFKKVHDDPLIYSVRVGLGYRALGAMAGDTVTWFWIGSHAEYDKLLDQL